MKRITVHIAENQYEWLHKKSEEMGVTAAEILRRAIEHWITVYERNPAMLLPEPAPFVAGRWLQDAFRGRRDSDPDASLIHLSMQQLKQKGSSDEKGIEDRLRSIEEMLEKLLAKQ